MITLYIVVVTIMGTLTFFMYGLDKRFSRLKSRRIPERTLHLLALFGGWIGAIAGQKFFRHKTRKLQFQFITWSIALLHGIACWVILSRI